MARRPGLVKRPSVYAVLAVLLMAGPEARAHRPSDAYLALSVEGARLQGRLEIALRDLALLAEVDADGDRRLTWGELRRSRPALERVLLNAVQLRSDDVPCRLRVDDLLLNDRLDGRYAWFALSGECSAPPRKLELRYDLLFGIDPSHRGILLVEAQGHSHAAVLAPQRRSARFDLGAPTRSTLFLDYLREGVHHIWAGTDHILFLIALLLPSVLVREGGRWRSAPQLSPALWDVTRVVTAFTLAHSVTLSLAATGLLRVPTAPAEALIAASVVVAALNNVYPLVTRARWVVAFGFGLIHGLGFASVLAEIGLPAQATLLSLLGFNLGVELGQLVIVLAVVPLAYALRRTRFYQRGLVAGGSLVTAVVACLWFGERVGWIDA